MSDSKFAPSTNEAEDALMLEFFRRLVDEAIRRAEAAEAKASASPPMRET